jgi:hypothetical protein
LVHPASGGRHFETITDLLGSDDFDLKTAAFPFGSTYFVVAIL